MWQDVADEGGKFQMSSWEGSPPVPVAKLPRHVAIIMDGNGRWAEQRGLPRIAGHREGAKVAQQVVELFIKYQIPYLTLYAFSTENWNRPRDEVQALFQLLEEKLDEGISYAMEKGIRLYHLGKLDGLSARVREKIKKALDLTRDNCQIGLCLAFNYGGRDEIIQAVRRLVSENVPVSRISESLFSQYLYSAGIPDPDLVIRTGGERRLSNFLTWQSAYAEIYFTPVLWPDLNKEEIDRALIDYSQRQRRFGALPS